MRDFFIKSTHEKRYAPLMIKSFFCCIATAELIGADPMEELLHLLDSYSFENRTVGGEAYVYDVPLCVRLAYHREVIFPFENLLLSHLEELLPNEGMEFQHIFSPHCPSFLCQHAPIPFFVITAT